VKHDTTTTPNMIPLTRGLGRSVCRQPYPCKYHYSQRGRFQKTHKNFCEKHFCSWNTILNRYIAHNLASHVCSKLYKYSVFFACFDYTAVHILTSSRTQFYQNLLWFEVVMDPVVFLDKIVYLADISWSERDIFLVSFFF